MRSHRHFVFDCWMRMVIHNRSLPVIEVGRAGAQLELWQRPRFPIDLEIGVDHLILVDVRIAKHCVERAWMHPRPIGQEMS